ncbi:Na(+)/H(+) antiporter subunit D [Solemya pervernicosa gill symbiont]|uniref:Na(+)/H(+) antiporter subunit D n=1 Tax=Solemya pervernicosa gill symbiont TaxID=642797 RepID=A0A1T2L3D2_9GAMM|nr:Na(+)/H(+) antiporter subunit D [Solemya pervernicosa gill symbiont]OOZ39510.1 Na(+)/H(+) antiporter subunit D [Solemya pervernicosa gill symbiont]
MLESLTSITPALPLFIGALLVAVTRGMLRNLVMLITPLVGAFGVYSLDAGMATQAQLMGLALTPVRVDQLSILFGYLFHLAAFIGVVFALHVKDKLQDVSALAYAGSAVGAVFAGDLLTLFVYWELLAVTSAALVFARRTERSLHTGIRYLLMQVGSGVLLLAGAIIYASQGNGLEFNHIGLDAPGGLLIFLAFGIKSAFPMLHSWLTDAYPESTPTGTVFLSAFTTKVAIYALARGYAGTEILIYIGALMACFPIFYAVIENDLRRVLAYSLINQLGFMVVGIGIGTELALNGAVSHAFNDVLFKGLLMMSMGAVLHVTGEIRGSELGGLYKKMPKTAILCMIGAASISAFPLFSGFVSKSMVVAAALNQGYEAIWLALLFAAAGVFHHAGIKIPFFAFFHHDSKHVATAHEAPTNMLIAMTIGAFFCIGIGSFPHYLYALLPYQLDYSPYDVSHVLAQLQLLAFSALAFTWLKLAHIYPPELKSVNVDIDWLYRRIMPDSVQLLLARLAPIDRNLRTGGLRVIESCIKGLVHHHGSYGILARTWPTGSMVMWVAVLLGLSLVLYYL